LSQSSFLKSRKHFRKHYIERDSPRIARRKNRQLFPRKDQNSSVGLKELRRPADPVPLSEIISEVIETFAGQLEHPAELEQSNEIVFQLHRGRR